ncbi:alpha/beta fold hydrolase [Gordonia humi]|uniref:Pimeloyl-ACP methyl ester carboxylesterase n=1 Tax=Gordonia humi TaxID=686429 RepID=A0A840F627_9ACTN|nr:alpha/beta hydrolase [Gordonia humi]MBB4137346.1 pimeloyl-ACP methyl ester carboxylesterase [Gordonia humi]
MSAFEVPGARLAVEFSDEHGAPVVQLHGLTSSRARDRLLGLDLGRGLSGTRLLRYDARGHGDSTGRRAPDDYRWTNLADDLLLLLDRWFPGERVHGVGPSMGTATLLYAAVREPDRFSGLTLMLPPTAWASRVAKADEYRAGADLVERSGVEAFAAAGTGAPVPPAAADAPLTMPAVTGTLLPSVLRGAARSDLPAPAELAAVAVPTTILAWIDDPAHPLATAETLFDVLPHAKLTVARTPDDVQTWPSLLATDIAARR